MMQNLNIILRTGAKNTLLCYRGKFTKTLGFNRTQSNAYETYPYYSQCWISFQVTVCFS